VAFFILIYFETDHLISALLRGISGVMQVRNTDGF